jgi:hypothetical protein
LVQALLDRSNIIAKANTPFKRPIIDTDPDGTIAQLNRRADETQNRGIMLSQWHREPILQRIPPNDLDKKLENLDPVPRRAGNSLMLPFLMEMNSKKPESEDASVDSDVRRELANMDVYRRAEATIADTASAIRNPPQSSILARRETRPYNAQGGPIPYDERKVYSRTSGLSLQVRNLDNRSFNDFGTQIAQRPVPNGRIPLSSQSFHAGQSQTRPPGVTIREHRRAGMVSGKSVDLHY